MCLNRFLFPSLTDIHVCSVFHPRLGFAFIFSFMTPLMSGYLLIASYFNNFYLISTRDCKVRGEDWSQYLSKPKLCTRWSYEERCAKEGSEQKRMLRRKRGPDATGKKWQHLGWEMKSFWFSKDHSPLLYLIYVWILPGILSVGLVFIEIPNESLILESKESTETSKDPS